MKEKNVTGKGQASIGKDAKALQQNQGAEGKSRGRKPAASTAGEDTAPLEKFFTDGLKDMYYAEQQLIQAIPKMEAAATTEELKDAFNDHLLQTQKQLRRLDKVFRMLGKQPEGKKCEAMDGLIKEVETIISDTPEGSMTRDAALIIAAQKVEHYEIASYGGLEQLALTMELEEVAELLDDTLMEEEDTDYLLTQVAEDHINMDAEHESSNYSWARSQGRMAGSQEDYEEEDEEEQHAW